MRLAGRVEWFLRTEDGGAVVVPWGGPGDVPVAGHYFGLGRAQIAVYRPATSEFILRDDLARGSPRAGDYRGLGRPQLALYRPGTGEWFIRADNGAITRVQWGIRDDVPVPAAFAPFFGVLSAPSAQSAGTPAGGFAHP